MAVWLSKGAGKFPLLSVVPSDVVGRVFTGFRTTSEDLGSTISDVVTKGAAKSISEADSIAVSLSKGAGKFPLLSVVPSDVVGRVFTGARAISENSVSAVSDSVTRAFTGFRSTSESLASAIAAIVNRGVARSLLEAPPISGTTSRLFTGFRGLAESPTVSDAIARLYAVARSLAETPTISDPTSRVHTGFRTTSGNLASAISDVVNKGEIGRAHV